MTSPLAGKHIVLGICGGIAAYKSVTLLRLLIKAGAEVQVVITPAGKEFITPVTLSALSHNPVISEFFTANTGEWHSHVDLGLWADCMVIAPATASTIGKMAHGIADNMLVTTYLSARSQVFVAPAMDFDMMAHPSTAANIALLRSYGNIIIEPASGYLASGLEGKGRMEEPERIADTLAAWFSRRADLAGTRALVTAGPTRERIDPVRYIGNYSSGKMGYAIADTLASRGAQVTLVSGPVAIRPAHPAVSVIPVESAAEMLDACTRVFPDVDIAVMCAAVADYTVDHPSPVKIKRENSEIPDIRLRRNPDIAATLGAAKRPGQTLVGFALETDHERDNAAAKMARKNLDMIVLNSLRDPGAGFGVDTNRITILRPGAPAADYPLKPKSEVAADIVDQIVKLRDQA